MPALPPKRVVKDLLTEYIIKIASRCNINCDYCYWFRDPSVYQQPKLMPLNILEQFKMRLVEKIKHYETLGSGFGVVLILHGGEPLLYGKANFVKACDILRSVKQETNTVPGLGVTTNGMLLDEQWCDIFKRYDVSVSISIDGDKQTHDASRKDFQGKGTFERTLVGLETLKKNKVRYNVLAVANPAQEPSRIFTSLVDELEFDTLDVLIPDFTHEESFPSIANYYIELFDIWYDKYAKKGVRMRYFDSIIKTLLGGRSESDELGGLPQRSIVLMPDGTLEPNDTLRIIGENSNKTTINVFDHKIDEIITDDVWYRAYHHSLNLPKTCQQCDYVKTCGGGPLQTRWSNARGFDNPSVYCDDLKKIYHHVSKRLLENIEVSA